MLRGHGIRHLKDDIRRSLVFGHRCIRSIVHACTTKRYPCWTPGSRKRWANRLTRYQTCIYFDHWASPTIACIDVRRLLLLDWIGWELWDQTRMQGQSMNLLIVNMRHIGRVRGITETMRWKWLRIDHNGTNEFTKTLSFVIRWFLVCELALFWIILSVSNLFYEYGCFWSYYCSI